MIENPFLFGPAQNDHFVGRQDVLDKWLRRLKDIHQPKQSPNHWLIIADGGMGKSSLLLKLQQIAQEQAKAHPIFIDFGYCRDCNSSAMFFETFDRQINQAGDFGTGLRSWLNLPAGSPESQVALEATRKLLKIAGLGLSITSVLDLSLSLPDKPIEKLEDIALRIASISANLRAVAKRRGPVVVMVDQLGKAHDSALWCTIARLLLSSISDLRNDNQARNIIFAVTVRPERLGLLDYQLQRPELFSEHVFDHIYLNPFSGNEARQAIRSRAQNNIPHNLVPKIIASVARNSRFDPYTVIQAGAAIWEYLFEGNSVDPSTIDEKEIRRIITNFYSDQIRYYQHSSSQWAVLKLLTYFPSGLTADEIVKKLDERLVQGQTTTHISSSEAETILQKLLENQGYPIITKITPFPGTHRYLIAHELLRDAILQQIPANQRELEQAQKMISEAMTRQDFLTEKELLTIWRYQDLLPLNETLWDTVVSSLVSQWSPALTYWLDGHSDGLIQATRRFTYELGDSRSVVRIALMLYVFLGEGRYLVKAILEIIRNRRGIGEEFIIGSLPFIATEYRQKETLFLLYFIARGSNGKESPSRQKAHDTLSEWGGDRFAQDVLTALSLYNHRDYLCEKAAANMEAYGGSAKELLSDLAQNSEIELVRITAAESLSRLGETDLALRIFAQMARMSEEDDIRRRSISNLVAMGQQDLALEILGKLASANTQDWSARFAVTLLMEMGQVAYDSLVFLARHATNDQARSEAITGLMLMGDNQLAREALLDFAQSCQDTLLLWDIADRLVETGENQTACDIFAKLSVSGDIGSSSHQAIGKLTKLGEIARKALFDLAFHHEDSIVCTLATEGLGDLGNIAREDLTELALHSPHEDVCRIAAKQLWKLGETKISKEVIINLVETTRVDWVRINAADLLAEMGEIQYAAKVYSSFFQSGPKDLSDWDVISGLVKLGDAAKESLFTLAKNALDSNSQYQAAYALVELGESARAELEHLAQNSSDHYVCQIAEEGLLRLGENDREKLTQLAFTGKDENIRFEAVKKLGKLGHSSVEEISSLARESPDDWVRWIAAQTLLELKSTKNARNYLLDLATNSDDDQIRLSASQGLADLGENRLACDFLAGLATRAASSQVQENAAKYLVKLGGEALVVLIKLSSYKSNERIRLIAAEGLIALGQPEPARATLLELALSGEDEYTRKDAVNLLVEITKDSYHEMIELVKTAQDEWVRFVAADEMVNRGESQIAGEVLLNLAIGSPSDYIRKESAAKLVEIGESAIPLLIRLALISEDVQVRQNVFACFVKLEQKTLRISIAMVDPFGPLSQLLITA